MLLQVRASTEPQGRKNGRAEGIKDRIAVAERAYVLPILSDVMELHGLADINKHRQICHQRRPSAQPTTPPIACQVYTLGEIRTQGRQADTLSAASAGADGQACAAGRGARAPLLVATSVTGDEGALQEGKRTPCQGTP